MSRSKQIGTAFETAVVNFLREHGFPSVERRTLSGKNDKGDIAGLPGNMVLECKAEKTISLSQYMKEAEIEAHNAGTNFFAAVVKRRQKNVADAYVVLPLRVFVRLLWCLSLPVEGAAEAVASCDR